MAEKGLCKIASESDDSREISFEASSLLLAIRLLQILPPDFCLKAPTTQFKPFLVSARSHSSTFEKTTLARSPPPCPRPSTCQKPKLSHPPFRTYLIL